MPVLSTHSQTSTPPFLWALVAIAALVVLAGLVSLYAGAAPQSGVDASSLL